MNLSPLVNPNPRELIEFSGEDGKVILSDLCGVSPSFSSAARAARSSSWSIADASSLRYCNVFESKRCSLSLSYFISDTTNPTDPKRKQSPNLIGNGVLVVCLSPRTRQTPECLENTSHDGIKYHWLLWITSKRCALLSGRCISVGGKRPDIDVILFFIVVLLLGDPNRMAPFGVIVCLFSSVLRLTPPILLY